MCAMYTGHAHSLRCYAICHLSGNANCVGFVTIDPSGHLVSFDPVLQGFIDPGLPTLSRSAEGFHDVR